MTDFRNNLYWSQVKLLAKLLQKMFAKLILVLISVAFNKLLQGRLYTARGNTLGINFEFDLKICNCYILQEHFAC